MAATLKLLFRENVLGFDGLGGFEICTSLFLVVVFGVDVFLVKFAWVHVARVFQGHDRLADGLAGARDVWLGLVLRRGMVVWMRRRRRTLRSDVG